MDFLKKYFAGQLTPQEEAQVQAWLVEHSEDPQVQDALLAIMSDMEAEDMNVSAPAYAKVSKRLGLERKSRFGKTMRTIGRWAMGVAACVVLPLLGAFLYSWLSVPEQAEWLELKVPYGQTDELVLADGTHLHLNAGTRITYPSAFLGSERRIFIEGEVFAEVAKNPEQPFVIASGDVDVKVLGTTFNFKAYDKTECVELILLEGSVQVDIDADTHVKQIQLHPGEMVQYDRKSGEIEMKGFQSHLYKGFHDDGAIHFFNLRLSDITMDLERLFGVKVVLLDEALAETRYFAWFSNNETLEQILDGINVDGRMKFKKKDNVIYISKKK
jgi:ferric-dicitrate binding protein FerR (iron transport regulator)